MLSFRALASGSSGNGYLLRTEKVALLFEAGIPLPRLERYLRFEGIGLCDLTGVLISHEHADHCLAVSDLVQCGVPVCGPAEVLAACGLENSAAHSIEPGMPKIFGDVQVRAFPMTHDSVHAVGYEVSAFGSTIVIATDLGEGRPEVREAIAQADLIVLEANHDMAALGRSRYPPELRRRIASTTGHLSNGQAAELLAKHVKGQGVEIWLAHLSNEANSPQLALRRVKRSLSQAGLSSLSVKVARRGRPSARWVGTAPRQLTFFTGAVSGQP